MTSPPREGPSTGERAARVVVLVVAVFCVCASAFSLFIAAILTWPNAALDGIWAAKPEARTEFVALGAVAVVLLCALAAVAVVIGIGLFRRWRWARWAAVVLLLGNVIPDVVRAITVDPTIFIPIVPVAAVVVYLALPVVGRTFGPRGTAR